MSSEIDLFREYVSAEAKLGQPATEREIAGFEEHYGVKFPPDVREYFLKINGVYISGGYVALEALPEWSLGIQNDYPGPEHIRTMLDEAEKYFRFGNYDVLVWDWWIKLNPDPAADTPIIVVDYGPPIKVAEHLTDFLRKFRTIGEDALLGL